MKVFSILKPSTYLKASNPHPKEDYFLISKKYPIFVVADGVTLNFDNDKDYPQNSKAEEASKTFCESVIAEAEKRYKKFAEKDLEEIFEIGNNAVFKYNVSQGLTKNTINYWDVDLYSATTSFFLIKGKKAYWWSLCDSGVLLCDKNGEKLFTSPNGWEIFKKNISKDWENMPEKEKIITMHKSFRNAVDKKGNPTGYGVADGEEEAKLYLNVGTLNIYNGDMVFLYTDGFEDYFIFTDFLDVFLSWQENMQSRLEAFIGEKSSQDQSKFGREKTLIVISV